VHTHDRWFRFDSKSGIVKLTKLYDWYGDDSKQVVGTVLAYVGTHSKEIPAVLDAKKPPRIEWLDYDWRLNSRENKP
jgi:hypothetical protein